MFYFISIAHKILIKDNTLLLIFHDSKITLTRLNYNEIKLYQITCYRIISFYEERYKVHKSNTSPLGTF